MHTLNPLAKKLQIKAGKRWLFYNAPPGYPELLEPLPDGADISFEIKGEFDGVQLFVSDLPSLEKSLQIITPCLKSETIFWVTYPKKSSGVNSGLAMMGDWDEPAKYGLRIVTSISVDETWTALRFKPVEHVKQSDTRNEEIKKNEYAGYIDVDTRQIILPDEIKVVLESSAGAMDFYQSLSYSNRKEYVIWILSARQERTKNERLVKMVEKLLAGKRNPSEK